MEASWLSEYGRVIGGEVEVYCLSGLDSRYCSRRFEEGMDDPVRVADLVAPVISSGKAVLLVSTGFQGFGRVLAELEEVGRNPLLVEATGVPESMLSGLSLDTVILFHLGHIALTLGERRRARKFYPPVTRRQLLKNLFTVTPRYVVQPRNPPLGCSVCPYNALGEEGLDESRCRGCMLCCSLCGGCTPAWTGPAAMAYLYRFVAEAGLDGVVFVCRSQLGLLDVKTVEASPARLAAFHVPCITWLSPRLLRVLEELEVHTTVLLDLEGACRGCWLSAAALRAVEELRRAGVVVSDGLSHASSYAFTGYSRRRRSGEEVAALLASAEGEGLRPPGG